MTVKVFFKNLFITVGLLCLSQVSSLVMGVMLGAGISGLGATIVLAIVFIVNIALLVWLAKKLGFLKFRFDYLNKSSVKMILLFFVLARVIAIVGTLLLQMQGETGTANDAALENLFTMLNPVIIFIMVAVSAPIMEEIVFRGAIMGLWLKDYPRIAIAVSSAAFGLMHGPTNLISFVMYAGLGFLFATAYARTNRLEASMSVHFLNNLPAGLLYLISGW